MNAARPTNKEIAKRERKAKRIEGIKQLTVSLGVYVALAIGVLGSQAINMSDNLYLTFEVIELGQMGGALLVAALVYNKLEAERVFAKRNRKNILRMMRHALQHGFFWMSIIGVWW